MNNDVFITVDNKDFTEEETKRIIRKYLRDEETKRNIELKYKDAGKSLLEICKKIYKEDSTTCNNYYTLLIKRSFYERGYNRYDRDYLRDFTITDVINNAELFKDYVIEFISFGTDCSYTIGARLNDESLAAFVKYHKAYFSNTTIFQDIITHEEFSLDYVLSNMDEFEKTVVIREVQTDENKKISLVRFMFNGGAVKNDE